MQMVAPQSPVSSRLGSPLLAAGVVVVGMLAWSGVARADCNEDFGKLMSKRMAQISGLNQISKNNSGKLDPVAACPRLKSLAAAEGEVLAYMQKNKDWCNLPDDLVEKMSASRAKTASIAVKACGFAAKMKEAQQQQAQQQPAQATVKLPAGPL